MKFMFMSEGETEPGSTHEIRYWDLVDEVIHAERWGFDAFGVSEQHLAIGAATTASPEVLFAYLFARTSRIRFRHAITLLPKNINHALKVASRTAVEDILSNGRIELAVGRGNTTLALRAFEVDLDKNRAEMSEGIQVMQKAFTEDPFMFHGEHYKIPPRSLVPKSIQKPYPPMFMAATSPESHVMAAEQFGIGILSWSSFCGYEMLAEGIGQFRKAAARRKQTGAYVNDTVGVLVQGYCAETDEQAAEDAGEANLKWLKLAIDGYPRLAKLSKDYAYMADVKRFSDRMADLDYFVNASGGAIFGSPDSCIKQIEKFKAAGADEVLIRIDSVPHAKIMKSIELFGRHVIPHFKRPGNIVRSSDEVIADIRRMRDKAKADGTYVELEEKGVGGKSAARSGTRG
ncbi:MAG: LLM class flavin-dependent oxidoreductase [Alphaproteobacteria bacterium]|nr:LLM class flavin-dependent oxidoreductase [Alphaproteobacteria bacterium]